MTHCIILECVCFYKSIGSHITYPSIKCIVNSTCSVIKNLILLKQSLIWSSFEVSNYNDQVDFDEHLVAVDRSSHGFGHACGLNRSGEVFLIEISCG